LLSKLSKKSQISPAFQYIFALVAGAILLIFFLKFAFQAESTGREVVKAEVLHLMDASLQAFSISGHGSDVIPKPPWPQRIHMKFGTGPNCGKFTIVGQKYFVSIPKVIFGPSEMKAIQLQAWTMSWSFPFRVTNFFYFINDRSSYSLVFDVSNQDRVRSISSSPPSAVAYDMPHFPEAFKIVPISSLTGLAAKSQTSDTVKVVYFAPMSFSGVPCSSKDNCVKGSLIDASEACWDGDAPGYECYGTVDFYDGMTRRGSSAFIGREMMFGAILADTIEEYNCQLGLALNDLERMISVYADKAEKMKLKMKDCEDSYNNANQLFLAKMSEDVGALKNDLAMMKADKAKVSSLSEKAMELYDFNKDTLGGYDYCETLF